jgi:sec-independent protein translocase protein TatC
MSELYSSEPLSMSLSGHLAELRRRILICLVFFATVVLCLFSQGYVLLGLLEAPAKGVIKEFIFTSPTEAFTTYFSVVLLAAFIVSFPVVLYQLWAFVAPAMPRAFRRVTVIWFLFALVSFFGGIAFAYAILLPPAFSFLVGFGEGIAKPMISLSQYMSFAVTIVFIGGVVFEIPFLMGVLTEAGLLNTKLLRSSRRYAILIIFILAAVITPTQDPFNMIIFAVPMVLLFEVGIMICTVIEKRKINMPQEKI